MEIQSHSLSRRFYIIFNLILALKHWTSYLFLTAILVIFAPGILDGRYSFVIIFVTIGSIIVFLAVLYTYISFSSGNRNFFLPTRYLINDQDIEITTPSERTNLKWTSFIRWERFANYYLLYVSNITFYVIDKSMIHQTEITQFESLLQQKITGIPARSTKVWTWKMITLVIINVLVSLWWTNAAAPPTHRENYISTLSTPLVIALVVAPLVCQWVVFYVLTKRKRSHLMNTISYPDVIHGLTIAGMISGSFYILLS